MAAVGVMSPPICLAISGVMVPAAAVLGPVGFWCVLCLADSAFKSSPSVKVWYEECLTKLGISIAPFHIRWQSTFFNRFFLKMGRWKPQFLYLWFSLGMGFGVVFMFISIILLTKTLAQTLAVMSADGTVAENKRILQVVVPGVNLPASQLVYFFTVILISGIIHEIGHGVAAVREQVRFNGFGMFIFVVYPGAFVDLYTNHLQLISPLQQLRVFCAGVWHNFILALMALLILYSLPLFLLPLYYTGIGALVTEVTEHVCLPARKTIESSRLCQRNADCQKEFIRSLCAKPSMENQTRLIRVKHSSDMDMLFVGHPVHLQYAVSLTNYMPRFGFLHLNIPVVIETFCKYPFPVVKKVDGSLSARGVVTCCQGYGCHKFPRSKNLLSKFTLSVKIIFVGAPSTSLQTAQLLFASPLHHFTTARFAILPSTQPLLCLHHPVSCCTILCNVTCNFPP
ncbi:membrane-bound transcription factor site-2 protease isoform X5 [Mobula hypostoma]|uniref:membrane-bound transcription factor site-2 protease isoform X5 n=1 Tax=Mobula hypostoma TaxID=723540 RepID=UPI002FC31170